jgi:hypothetical protein
VVDLDVDVDVDDEDDEHAPTTITQPAMAASALTERACRREPKPRKVPHGHDGGQSAGFVGSVGPGSPATHAANTDAANADAKETAWNIDASVAPRCA